MVKEATEAYREDMDSLAGFLTEYCVVRPEAWASSRALWEAYQAYSKGDRWAIPTQRAFGVKLKGHGFEPEGNLGLREAVGEC
jgi:putative DNA primase/helicase